MDKAIRFACIAMLSATVTIGAYAQGAATEAASPRDAAAVDETTLAIADAPPAEAVGATSSIGPYFLRMMLVLGLVIAAIYGMYALLKRSARPKSADDSYLRVLAATTLAAGRSLHVVSLGDKAWLIGSTDTSVGLISEIQDKELIDALALRAAEAPQTPRKDFASMLIELLGRKAVKKTAVPDPGDFFSRQKDRLKKF
jgi:flagellar protein FliO/FliZ